MLISLFQRGRLYFWNREIVKVNLNNNKAILDRFHQETKLGVKQINSVKKNNPYPVLGIKTANHWWSSIQHPRKILLLQHFKPH